MNTSTPKLARLIYGSRMAKGCGPKELQSIMGASRENNEAMGITGALCYSPRGFLQCLEGPPEAVNEICRRIVQDARNENATLLDYSAIEERGFSEWTMAYERMDDVDKSILARYGLTEFDPCTISADQALGVLQDTARERAAFLRKAEGEAGTRA